VALNARGGGAHEPGLPSGVIVSHQSSGIDYALKDGGPIIGSKDEARFLDKENGRG
jgi:hypothetical protein